MPEDMLESVLDSGALLFRKAGGKVELCLLTAHSTSAPGEWQLGAVRACEFKKNRAGLYPAERGCYGTVAGPYFALPFTVRPARRWVRCRYRRGSSTDPLQFR
jgi:hypothetical protein